MFDISWWRFALSAKGEDTGCIGGGVTPAPKTYMVLFQLLPLPADIKQGWAGTHSKHRGIFQMTTQINR